MKYNEGIIGSIDVLQPESMDATELLRPLEANALLYGAERRSRRTLRGRHRVDNGRIIPLIIYWMTLCPGKNYPL